MQSDSTLSNAVSNDFSSLNPLLNLDSLPLFKSIKGVHIQPAVEEILQANRKLINELVTEPKNLSDPDWESLMEPLDAAEDRLDKVWSTASHLNGVMNTPEIRAAYDQCQPLITDYHSELGQNQQLYQCVQRLHERAEELRLESSQRKIINDILLEFRLAGVSLDEDKKQQFMELERRLSKLSNEFGNNVLDATRAWSKNVTDEAMLSGLPETNKASAAQAARQKNLEGYLLTLDFPCYVAVMTNADNASLREEMYRAFGTRASDQDSFAGKWDNRQKIDEILSCRAQLADLLGYDNYAELSVARKMARSAGHVSAFLEDLISHSLPAARREFAELKAFAREQYQLDELNAWDVSYYSEKLRKQSFDVSQEELRAYFPVETVKQGLFEIVKNLYGVEITRNTSAEIWDELVEFYDISRDGQQIASFYFDLFTREGKRGGAWMAGCRNRRQLDTGWQLPVAYLICNYGPPTGSEPALLTHNEVATLFHEFGHGLHHMLTSERYLRSAGINGVAWDAVELPSQLMENWCWQRQGLAMISRHYKEGGSLPENLLEKMLAAKNFQAGMKSMRQLEFALFDFRLHQTASAELPQQQSGEFVSTVLTGVRSQTAVYPVPEFLRFQNSFSHIFAGGYAAGYYSYKWAEVLSADVFSRFTQTGVFNRDTGKEFLNRILARGGGADALTLFTDFMGREPDISALLRQDGLA
jgi:oligopeptidase A